MIDDDGQMIDAAWLCCVLDWDAGWVSPGCSMLQELSTQCQVAPTGEVRAISQDLVSTCLWMVPPGAGWGGQAGWQPLDYSPPPHPTPSTCHQAQKNSLLSKEPGCVFVVIPCMSPLSQNGVPWSFWSQSLRPELLPRVGAQVCSGCHGRDHRLSDFNSRNVCSVTWKLEVQEEGISRAGSSEASPLGL